MDNQNYLMLNGVKIELTHEQLEQLKSGIKQPVDFSDYNETDWFYYKLDDNNEWISKNAFGDSTSFCFNYEYHRKNNLGGLCAKEDIIEFRRPTTEELEILYKHHPEYKSKIKWEDFGEVNGYYITGNGAIVRYELTSHIGKKNVFPTKEEAEACLALSQLLQWRDKYNEGWRPDWKSRLESKYVIRFYENELTSSGNYHNSYILSFKTKEIGDKFLEDFRDLIEIAKPLL